MADFDFNQSLIRLKIKNDGGITIRHPPDFLVPENIGDDKKKEIIKSFPLTRFVFLHHCSPKLDEAITMRVIVLCNNDELIIKIFCPHCGLRLPDGNHVKLRTIKDFLNWCEWDDNVLEKSPAL